MSGAIQFSAANEICFRAFHRKRGGNLKLMNHRMCLFDRIARFSRAELRGGCGGTRFVPRFVLIVDDEDSRNASVVGEAAERPGSCGQRYVGADTG